MLDLNNHLDPNENIIIFFRPSRKAYIHKYFILILLLFISVFAIVYPGFFPFVWNILYAKILFGVAALLFVYCIITLLRLEYRIWSRRYALTNQKIIYSRGIFSENYKSIRYGSVRNIALQQTLWDKIMNTGTLTVDTSGTKNFEIRFREISEPFSIKQEINKNMPIIEQ